MSKSLVPNTSALSTAEAPAAANQVFSETLRAAPQLFDSVFAPQATSCRDFLTSISQTEPQHPASGDLDGNKK
jgi:hypothetical protein